jgi:uncharacterized protein YjiK
VVNARQLSIDAVGDVPLREVSGLGQRRHRAGDVGQVLAVGDEEFALMLADLDAVVGGGFHAVDLRKVIGSAAASEGSEWEAADGDATGRVFVLQESPSRVFVLNVELDEVERVIDLRLDAKERAELNWDASSNARAEGLVLLRNGHLLVAKEKDPPLLLEFGPARGRAEGLAPELVFSRLGEFHLPQDHHTDFSLLSAWRLEPEAHRRIDDISDVAAGPDERLYLLSDESRCIAQLEPALAPSRERVGVTAVWDLPEELQQPEDLVIREDLVPVVAIDKDEPSENLFVMASLD